MDIIKAVGSALAKCEVNGGKENTVFTESAPHPVEPPCFFVKESRRTCARQVGERFSHNVEISVCYYPENKLNPREECEDIAQALFAYLEYIDTDEGLIRSTDKHCEIKDGILEFTFSVQYCTINSTDTEKMENIVYNSRRLLR